MDDELRDDAFEAPDAHDRAAEDAAVARVRAAQPPVFDDRDVDVVALRAAVAARLGGAEGRSPLVDELAERRARRARRLTGWPARAAAVAVVALAVGGGGGYALGASGGGPDAGAPAFADGADASDAAPEDLSTLGLDLAAEGAADEGAGGGRIAADMGFGGWFGRTVFSAEGLSTEPSSARAWALDATGVSQAAAEAAAEALGVSGAARLEYGTWVVGSQDGTGPSVSLSADGTGSLSFWNPTKEVWWCDGGDTCAERDLGPAPTGDAALDVLRAQLVALGADPADFELTVDGAGDPTYTYVTAHQVVEGRRTGLSWSATLTGAGLSSLYGFTGRLVDLGTYDVVSPAEAVARLNDPRFSSGVGLLRAAEGAILEAPEMLVPDGVPPTPVQPGASFSWPVQFLTVTQARLGLTVVTGASGAAALVPAYELTASDGAVWSVVAVAETHLDFAG